MGPLTRLFVRSCHLCHCFVCHRHAGAPESQKRFSKGVHGDKRCVRDEHCRFIVYVRLERSGVEDEEEEGDSKPNLLAHEYLNVGLA
jgi:hypothetical protein